MSDRGSAMMSGEFTAGLTALGILHVPTLPRSPHVYVPEQFMFSPFTAGRDLQGQRAALQNIIS